MDWNFVKVYLALYRQHTIADAAKALKMSESTLARHLNQIQSSMGKIFYRQGGRYRLTPFGEEILAAAIAVEQTFNDINRRVFAKDALGASTVKITAPTSYAFGYLPLILEQLKLAYPEIAIELMVSNDPVCLDARQADIAIRVTQSPPDNYIGKKVREVHWSAYGGFKYCEDYGAPTALEELIGHRMIGAAGTLANHHVFRGVARKFSDNSSLRCDDLVAMCSLTINNHGISFLPDEFNQKTIQRLFTLDKVRPNQLWVLTHSDFRNVERVRIVARYLEKALGKEDLIPQ